MTEYVVNDALAVTQYLTQHLNESRAIAYLASIAGLTLDDWKDAKTLLDTVEKTRRHTKEANIKDIVTVFFNTCVETQFVLKNLSLAPGWGLEFIALANYTASAVEVAKQISSRITSSSPVCINEQQQNQEQFPTLATAYTTQLSTNRDEGKISSNVYSPQQPPAPSSDWKKGTKNKYVRAQTSSVNSSDKQNKSLWLQGTGTANNGEKKHQLRFLCLGVRSGSDETAESLQAELEEKWKGHGGIKVEAVSATYHSALFRVQMNLTPTMYDKWDNPSMWPTRMSAALWRGNPRSTLQPPLQRIHYKRIYVGNLQKDLSIEKIKSNMESI